MDLPRLGINIDHIATLRQLRGTPYPDLVEAVRLSMAGGAQQITVHLREDRRHIQDSDIKAVRAFLGHEVPGLMNLEMAVTDEMVRIAVKTRPEWTCLVPEKRQEVTTEGGLAIEKNKKRIAAAIAKLHKAGIKVSLFVEPSEKAVKLSHELGADAVELHTGKYCLAAQKSKYSGGALAPGAHKELVRVEKALARARRLGMGAHVGHGLDYYNVRPIAALVTESRAPLAQEYNIGHSVICRAAIVGLERAVKEMHSAIAAP
jgi:pyridoxine 5-phosphate synthase